MKKISSPIDIIEQILFERLGNTQVRVWHYTLLLFLLFIVPIFIPASIFPDSMFFGIFSAMVIITWITSRLIGRQLSKTSDIDSILIYRFFAAMSWIIPTVPGWMTLLVGRITGVGERQILFWIMCFGAIVSLMHIIGIVIHLRHKDKLIRNVKKEDLFQ